MSALERAKLIPVSGNNDDPDMANAIDVQFNPTTLKVSMSNTLKENPRGGNSRSAQMVDKSSSNLTVELVFDTTYVEESGGGDKSGSGDRIEQGSDVRIQTRKIAEKFLKPVISGNQMKAPSRILFQWGSFEFVGMLQSFDETLDFFSPKGRPLRATVALKLSEDRYQARTNDSDRFKADQVPELTLTGATDPGSKGTIPGQNNTSRSNPTVPVPGGSDGPGNWRENALFNGIESPRLPAVPALALPGVNLGTGMGFGMSGGIALGLNPGTGMSVDLGGNGSHRPVTPAFRYGNSAALGTGVPGAFSPNPKTALNASALQTGALRLRVEAPGASAGAGGSHGAGADGRAGVAADTAQNGGAGQPGRPSPATGSHERLRHDLSVAALLKNAPDSGVGFD
ncbi:MAG: hypothetical protein WC012_03650 [Thiohalomonadaceae bacterium]